MQSGAIMPRVASPTITRCAWKANRWLVDGIRDGQGNRIRRFFTSREAAAAYLTDHREKARQEGRAGLTFTQAERNDARRALDELRQFASAQPERAGGVTLTDAARHYVELLNRLTKTEPVAELITRFIEAKEADGRSDRYLSDLRSRLSDFGRTFGGKPAAAVSTRDLDEWLRSLAQKPYSLSPQSRVNFRRVLHALFQFGLVQDLVRENPVARTARPKVLAAEPGILTPAQMTVLLQAAAPALKPVLAIGGFAGLRPAELHRLSWDAVDLEQRHITVSAKASKTASRRIVMIADNLLAWLLQAPKRLGSVCPADERKLFETARKSANITDWPSDALRHSWVTYRFALTNDAAVTAAEAGHDQTILHRHYRALATRTVAEQWFAIFPNEGVAAAPIPFTPVASQA